MAEDLVIQSKSDHPFPLHSAVWHNDAESLDELLALDKFNLEEKDPHGRTPLMLAVTLGHLEIVKILLNHGCNVNVENKEGWTVVQEATSTGDPVLLSTVLENRDLQRFTSRIHGIAALLNKLSEAPDFYVEMKWEFTSWVPLVSRMCPSDTYRVYKRGSNVRIDTTLLGFDQTQWQRGNRSYIFQGQPDGATMMEVDHDTKQVYVETMQTLNAPGAAAATGQMTPHPSTISHRLTTPIVTTFIDTDKISFERDKSGIWGWRNDRSEIINGQDCKVFSASNVELVTKSRTEHLTEDDKKQNNSPKSPIQSFLNIAEEAPQPNAENEVLLPQEVTSPCDKNPNKITPEEYFDPACDLSGRDIGRPKEVATKIQKFKGHLWLAEDYPLKLQEQVMHIVDLMAISSSHFAKLKDFIQMQLPSGFPVKIEIPLFHVLTARITFGNIFGLDESVKKVSTIQENERLTCIIEDSIFEPPSSYTRIGAVDNLGHHRQMAIDEDDALLQYAIQQSLQSSIAGMPNNEEQIDIWEALQTPQRSLPNSGNSSHPNSSSSPSRQTSPLMLPLPVSSIEEANIQRAIEESLALSQMVTIQDNPSSSEEPTSTGSQDPDMALALSLSQKEQEEEEQRRKEEDAMLKQILELSLKEQ